MSCCARCASPYATKRTAKLTSATIPSCIAPSSRPPAAAVCSRCTRRSTRTSRLPASTRLEPTGRSGCSRSSPSTKRSWLRSRNATRTRWSRRCGSTSIAPKMRWSRRCEKNEDRQMKISAIEAIPVRLPREREKAVRTAGSPTPLVDGAGNYRWSAVFPVLYAVHFETALVKVTLDNGFIGWGEAQAPLAPEVACAIIDRLLEPVLTGAEFDGSIARIERLWDHMYATMRVRGHTAAFLLHATIRADPAPWHLSANIHATP